MNNELYHHGILGMKWGVRRYQNKDGTLTAAGKERYTKIRDQFASNATTAYDVNRHNAEMFKRARDDDQKRSDEEFVAEYPDWWTQSDTIASARDKCSARQPHIIITA